MYINVIYGYINYFFSGKRGISYNMLEFIIFLEVGGVCLFGGVVIFYLLIISFFGLYVFVF